MLDVPKTEVVALYVDLETWFLRVCPQWLYAFFPYFFVVTLGLSYLYFNPIILPASFGLASCLFS